MSDQRPLTFDHLQSRKKPLERQVPVYTNDEAPERLEKASVALETAKTREMALRGTGGHEEAKAGLAEAQAEHDAAVEAVEESVLWVRFRSKGRKRYDKLVQDHPPTEAQEKEAKDLGLQVAPYNGETFAPALIAMCAVEPEMTLEQATQISEDWNTNELMDLFTAAMYVSTQRRTDVLGKAFG